MPTMPPSAAAAPGPSCFTMPGQAYTQYEAQGFTATEGRFGGMEFNLGGEAEAMALLQRDMNEQQKAMQPIAKRSQKALGELASLLRRKHDAQVFAQALEPRSQKASEARSQKRNGDMLSQMYQQGGPSSAFRPASMTAQFPETVHMERAHRGGGRDEAMALPQRQCKMGAWAPTALGGNLCAEPADLTTSAGVLQALVDSLRHQGPRASGMPTPFAPPGLERLEQMPEPMEQMDADTAPMGNSIPLPTGILERQFTKLLRPPASFDDAGERDQFEQRLQEMMKLSQLLRSKGSMDAVGAHDTGDGAVPLQVPAPPWIQAPRQHGLAPKKQPTLESIAMTMSSTDIGESHSGEDFEEAEIEENEPGREISAVPRPLGQAGSIQTMTTLMVRNVPVMYSMAMLLVEWPNEGTYDFVYLPYSVSLQRNQTYAFINFTSEAAATKFRNTWQKRRLAHYSSRKALNIGYADIQGRDANLMQFKAKPVRHGNISNNYSEPIVFENGVRVPLTHALSRLDGYKGPMSFV